MTSKLQHEPETARSSDAGGAGFASRVTREELATGAVLLVLENAATPTVSLRGSLRAGSYFEPRDRPGLARITAEMLKRGTRRRGKLELADDDGGRVVRVVEGVVKLFEARGRDVLNV